MTITYDTLISNNYKKKVISIDDTDYNLSIKKQIHMNEDAPRLVIVSYLPDERTIALLKIAIESIKLYTDCLYELWVIDNNSPIDNLNWLIHESGLNIILNRTTPKIEGSYANAIGLELAAHTIDRSSKYLMTLHQDIAVCKGGWLSYLISKFDKEVRAVGVRMDTKRVKEGVLHVLGYIIDFQLFRQLNLSFLPDLPKYDVGDKAIVNLRKAGYKTFATPNTLWDKKLINYIKLPYKNLRFDMSVDEEGDVVFMHLGRGILKSNSSRKDKRKSIERWIRFSEKNLVSKRQKGNINTHLFNKLITNLSYSVRRYYVDDFFFRNIQVFDKYSKILDMGGRKVNKRGEFNIDNYDLKVSYADINKDNNPDFLCDIKNIPVPDGSFDGIILSEVLEHVPEPELVLEEVYRILKVGGTALICTPFLFHIHADPQDFGRYTDSWMRNRLGDIGFDTIMSEKQGLFFSVLANMLKLWVYEQSKGTYPTKRWRKKVFRKFVFWFVKKAFKFEQNELIKNNTFFASNTTGFGIICRKQFMKT